MNWIPNTDEDRREMLAAIGISSIDDLFSDIPEAVRFRGKMNIPGPLSEDELAKTLESMAASCGDVRKYVCFLGGGAYDHFIPSVVGHVAGRSEFYTAYTPYQPEVSQAVLQSIFEYQTMTCQLMEMDVGNASMYDGATAAVEAALLAAWVTRRKKVVVSRAVHPEYRAVLKTYMNATEMEVIEVGLNDLVTDMEDLRCKVSGDVACAILQNPNFFGYLEDMGRASAIAHSEGALFVAAVDPISLGILKPPGRYDADVAVSEGQCLGNRLGFGGPYLGVFTAKERYLRRMPGRIVGETVDAEGSRGFVLTLQTREQHIRRERATSNICSNEALCALAATVYLAALGKQGMRELAYLCAQKAHYLHDRLCSLPGFSPGSSAPFFKEFTVRTPGPASKVVSTLAEKGLLVGPALGRFYPEMDDCFLVAVTERRTREEMDRLCRELEGWR